MSALNTIVEQPLRMTVALTGRLRAGRLRRTPLRHLTALLDFLARGAFHVWRQRRYLTCVKLANMALVNVQFKLKTERVLGRPYRMKIEPTNICNTHCQLCPTGIGLEGRPKGKMTHDQFRRLVDGFRHHLVSLDLSMWGDPLIVPDIYRMIRYAHDRRIWTYLSSNLHAFKPERGQAELLVVSGLDMLTCSLHGASQQTYEIYQPGKDLEAGVAKIRAILATRDRLASATPRLQLNFVVTRHNEHEIDDFKALADRLGCEPVFSAASMNARFVGRDRRLVDLGLAPDLKKQRQRRHLEQWLPRDPQYALEPYRQMLAGTYDEEQWNGRKLMDCWWPWRATVINWDGNVVTCCGSFDPGEDMGNVFDTRFGRIWNGRKYRLARRSYRRRLSGADAEHTACAGCPGFLL